MANFNQIPWWAIAGAAPIVAGQAAIGVSKVVDALNSINNYRNEGKLDDAANNLNKFTTSRQVMSYTPTGLTQKNLDIFNTDRDKKLAALSTPSTQKISDFAVSGKPASEMDTANMAAINQFGDSGIPSNFSPGLLSPDEKVNPIVRKSLADFQAQQANIGLTSDVLKNPTPENVARLIQTNPEHFASNMKNATAMLATPQEDTETPALRDFTIGALETVSTSTDLNDFLKKSGKLLSDTKADPTKAAALIEKLSKNYETAKNQTDEMLIERALKGDKEAKAILDEKDRRMAKRTQTNVSIHQAAARQTKAANLNINGLNQEENNALGIAVSEGRLDPYKINSRNQKMLASMEMQRPGINLNALAAQAGIARNKDVIMKAGVAEMIPGLLKETVQAGAKLNYSPTQFVGKIEKWSKGQLNDPKLVEYMTLRNDQLLTIGGVMRSNGMTDMAQRLEEEAAHPTLSPKALNGWLEGQLKSIDPRLSLYRKLTAGNNNIPRSSYQPGQGAKKLMSENNDNSIVERRKTKDGRILVKRKDGTVGVE